MTHSSPIKTDVTLHSDFAASSEKKPKRRKKRPAPLSLRLSDDERAHLHYIAGNQPIGRYIKNRLFAANDNKHVRVRQQATIKDYEALGKIHGKFAHFDVFLTMKELLAVNDNVCLKPETEEALRKACSDIGDIRHLIMKALGAKAE